MRPSVWYLVVVVILLMYIMGYGVTSMIAAGLLMGGTVWWMGRKEHKSFDQSYREAVQERPLAATHDE